jgi:hypothetical protein
MYPTPFQTTFVHPSHLRDDERTHTSAESVLSAYLDIDWRELARISSGERGSDQVLNAYYYFEVRHADGAGHTHTLNISGEYAAASDPLRFTIDHAIPVSVTKRGFLGLGAARRVVETRHVHMERCTPEAARAALAAFVSHDADYLRTNVFERTFPDD